jgi:hypothetical protein
LGSDGLFSVFFTPKNMYFLHLLDHEAQNNHTAQTISFDFDSTTILSQQSNSNKRKLTEASQIWVHQESAVNIKTDHKNLKKCYFSKINKVNIAFSSFKNYFRSTINQN